jgi:hypothetical protein
LFRADDPWPQPLKDIRHTRIAPASNAAMVFDDSPVIRVPQHLLDRDIESVEPELPRTS